MSQTSNIHTTQVKQLNVYHTFIKAYLQRRDEMVSELFTKYDSDKDGLLDAASYREFLVGINSVLQPRYFKEANYATAWAADCKVLGCDPAVGISLAAFQKLYGCDVKEIPRNRFTLRGEKLEADYTRVTEYLPTL